jgi:diguanylate cyclase (GGDEF)-like protein/PAS domain S-box-containing protein
MMQAFEKFMPCAANDAPWADSDALAALFDAGGAAMALIDLKGGRFEQVNPRCRELLGLDAERARWLRLADLAPEAERAGLLGALRSDGRWEGEWAYRRAEGALVWLQAAVCVARRDEGGEPTHAVAVMLDVSEQRRSLERLRAKEELSLQSQLAGGLAIFSRDLRTNGVTSSTAALAMLGLPDGQSGINVSDALGLVLPEDAPRLRQSIAETLARGEKTLRAEFRVRRANDGQLRDIELRAQYEYDENGLPLRSLGVAIDVTERKQTEQRLEFAAHHDALTGLSNRKFFNEQLAEACAYATQGQRIAVLCLDLDRFKDVNDTLGHPIGDQLLVLVGRRLRSQLRAADKLARLGGDEFAIVQMGLREPEDASLLARRLVAKLREPFVLDGQRVVIGVSVGVAVAPRDGFQAQDLLKAADLALYEAKAQPNKGWRHFEPKMNAQAKARYELESELRHALEAQEFELFYQPMLDAPDLTVMKFEALIRWRHPLRGLLSPDSFIPACELNGMICEMGDWVLRQACADAATWPHDIGVAVNVSAVQLASGDLDISIADALQASGLNADRLEVEITETALLQNTEATFETLLKVKALGVRIVMDDFGVGYASLGYLQSFPFDKVKLDRSFTRDVAVSPQGAAKVKAMLDLCAAFDLATTLEGVETQAQLEALARLGGTKVQGFLFSPPRPADCVPELIERFGRGAASPPAAA